MTRPASVSKFMGGGRYAGCRFVPAGAIRTKPEAHYTFQAGPGVVDMSRAELHDLVEDLRDLLRKTEDVS